MLDAPVSGGTTGADNATLCVMVGGDKDVYEKYKPVLDLIGSGRIDVAGLVTGHVDIDQFPATFEAMKTPSDQIKVMLEPE